MLVSKQDGRGKILKSEVVNVAKQSRCGGSRISVAGEQARRTDDCEATSPVSLDCCFAFFIIRSAQACQTFLIEVFYSCG